MKNLILTILLLNFLMVAGLAGFLMATGRLDGPKTKAILALLRQPGSPANLNERVGEILQPPSSSTAGTLPATAPAGEPHAPIAAGSSIAASALDRLEYARQSIEQERLRLDREAQDLLQRQRLLETQRLQVDARLTQINEARKKFETEVQAYQARTKSESFTRSLALYSELKPKQVKDLFLALPQDLVADYLQAMDSEQATKVISEFKKPEERQYIAAVMEKIRAAGTTPAMDPGTSPATAPGAAAARF